MLDNHRRRLAVETAVFAAALLMTVFVARELWRRRGAAALPPSESGLPEAAVADPARPAPPSGISATERGMSSVPSIKFGRIGRSKPRQVVVPAPR